MTAHHHDEQHSQSANELDRCYRYTYLEDSLHKEDFNHGHHESQKFHLHVAIGRCIFVRMITVYVPPALWGERRT